MSLQPPVGPDDHQQGPADAPVTLVEYADYQCPYCGEAYPQLKRIQQMFGDQLRFVFRNFPIPQLHPEAMSAAETAEFCGSKDQFWPAHDALFENQDSLGPQLYEQIATQLGLSTSDLVQALENDEFQNRIEADIDSGLRSGVNGTPSFFINGEKFEIENSYQDLVDAIQQEINAATQ